MSLRNVTFAAVMLASSFAAAAGASREAAHDSVGTAAVVIRGGDSAWRPVADEPTRAAASSPTVAAVSAAGADMSGGATASAPVVSTSIEQTPVAAQPAACGEWIAPGMPEGPIALGFNEADVATGRRVCPRTEVSIGERADATIATEDFYGSIGATSLVSASWAQTPRRELFFTVEGFHYGWTVNAVIESTDVGFGQLTAGASQIVASGDRWATATSARLMLPTSMLMDVRVVGAELGQALTYRPTGWLEVHGYAGVDGSAALFAAPQPRFGGFLNAGVQWNALSRFAVVLDANARVGGFAWYVAPAAALRFRIAEGGGLELAATRPVVGTDRRTVIAGLRLGWRL
ncbi:MAG: hypothetical protein IRZ16_05600 [Myxococcaceae bacterium]|nr:hypothetical protein [Myxococcaceae bacterium]